jgi:hypothetical protein
MNESQIDSGHLEEPRTGRRKIDLTEMRDSDRAHGTYDRLLCSRDPEYAPTHEADSRYRFTQPARTLTIRCPNCSDVWPLTLIFGPQEG